MGNNLGSTLTRTVEGLFWKLVYHKVSFQFKNRYAAGDAIGSLLKHTLLSITDQREDKAVVVGIPRGGLVTAHAVARKLTLRLEGLVVRRLVAPCDDGITIGAITQDPIVYLNIEVIDKLGIPLEYVEREKIRRIEEIKSITSRLNLNEVIDLENARDKTVILVDDGAASGATLIAAARHLKARCPKSLNICMPIAPKKAVCQLKNEADNVYCIFVPEDDTFNAVEQYYKDFSQIVDVQIARIVNDHNNLLRANSP